MATRLPPSIQKGAAILQQAVQRDTQGDAAGALVKYKEGISFLLEGLRDEQLDSHARQHIQTKVSEYLQRAENLQLTTVAQDQEPKSPAERHKARRDSVGIGGLVVEGSDSSKWAQAAGQGTAATAEWLQRQWVENHGTRKLQNLAATAAGTYEEQTGRNAGNDITVAKFAGVGLGAMAAASAATTAATYAAVGGATYLVASHQAEKSNVSGKIAEKYTAWTGRDAVADAAVVGEATKGAAHGALELGGQFVDGYRQNKTGKEEASHGT